MRLTDLEPRWLSPHFFIFRCPCCVGKDNNTWLSCKSIPMTMREQREMVESVGMLLRDVAPTQVETCWSFSGPDFSSITVRPSINAEASGNWHGFITDGVIS